MPGSKSFASRIFLSPLGVKMHSIPREIKSMSREIAFFVAVYLRGVDSLREKGQLR